MDINLYQDLVDHLKLELTSLGYNITATSTQENVVHIFMNLVRRLINPKPRVVLQAKEFCCPAEFSEGLHEVARKIVAGEDLSPHLSRHLRKPLYNDALLNDWGVHHIHLGTTFDPDGFVKRTKPLLFARFDEAAAYLIGIYEHGAWQQQNIIQILHENWPDSISEFRINRRSIEIATAISDDSIKNLRKNNINAPIKLVDGTAYLPIGGGYSASGLSTEVVINADRLRIHMENLEEAIAREIKRIEKEAKEHGVTFPNNPQFKLKIHEGNIYATEINCMVTVPLGALPRSIAVKTREILWPLLEQVG